MHSQELLKQQAAQAALEMITPHLQENSILGIGTGSTVEAFISLLGAHKHSFHAAVSSSERSTKALRALGIKVLDLNEVIQLVLTGAAEYSFYVDGADEIDHDLNMIKGGGGALTREKIVSTAAQAFICIADESKFVETLGKFPLPVEVIPIAREQVRWLLRNEYDVEVNLREDFTSDDGNQILDIVGLDYIDNPLELESSINDIPGVVTCGLFAMYAADIAIIAGQDGVKIYQGEQDE